MSQDLGDSTLGTVSKAFREHVGLDKRPETPDEETPEEQE